MGGKFGEIQHGGALCKDLFAKSRQRGRLIEFDSKSVF